MHTGKPKLISQQQHQPKMNIQILLAAMISLKNASFLEH